MQDLKKAKRRRRKTIAARFTKSARVIMQLRSQLDTFRRQLLIPAPISTFVSHLKKKENIYCIVCMTEKRNIILRPCGHLCLCSGCVDEMGDRLELCPICFVKFDERFKIYWS
jgi:Zinc finger, C3HC4 type (RING finger)